MKALWYKVIAQLGLPQLLHRKFFQDKLTIVTYHAVVRSPLKFHNCCFLDESSFQLQVKYLQKHFEVIPLSEAIERMRSGGICHPTAVITFDDGYQSNYDVAFPILHEAGLPATIFLTTGLINTSDTVWFCRLNRSLAETNRTSLEWSGSMFDLSGPGSKAETAATIQDRLKEFPHPRLLFELRRLILELNDDPDRPIEVGSPFRMLSHEAIVKMDGSGLIEFGAHSHTHAILSLLAPEERRDEIERSVAAVQKITGRPCELFAYPNGCIQDYDAEAIALLEGCGVRASVTTIAGPNDEMTPAMELRRYGVGADNSIAYFQLTVHHFIAQLRRIMR